MRPQQYNYIIGAASLWLFIPVSVGLKLCDKLSCNKFTIIILVNTCTCMIVDTIMWSNYDNKSIIYKLDLLFATIQFILLNLVNIVNKNINYIVQGLLSTLILLFYFITNIFHKRQEWLFNIWSHLIFRYFGYLFCHLMLISDCYNVLNIVILTVIYYFHILLSLTLLNIQYEYHVYLVSTVILLMVIFNIY